MNDPPKSGTDAARQNELRAKVGDELRAMYDDVLNEPLPDSFIALLDNLDQDDQYPDRQNVKGETAKQISSKDSGRSER